MDTLNWTGGCGVKTDVESPGVSREWREKVSELYVASAGPESAGGLKIPESSDIIVGLTGDESRTTMGASVEAFLG